MTPSCSLYEYERSETEIRFKQQWLAIKFNSQSSIDKFMQSIRPRTGKEQTCTYNPSHPGWGINGGAREGRVWSRRARRFDSQIFMSINNIYELGWIAGCFPGETQCLFKLLLLLLLSFKTINISTKDEMHRPRQLAWMAIQCSSGTVTVCGGRLSSPIRSLFVRQWTH